jgi:hypothetical protein
MMSTSARSPCECLLMYKCGPPLLLRHVCMLSSDMSVACCVWQRRTDGCMGTGKCPGPCAVECVLFCSTVAPAISTEMFPLSSCFWLCLQDGWACMHQDQAWEGKLFEACDCCSVTQLSASCPVSSTPSSRWLHDRLRFNTVEPPAWACVAGPCCSLAGLAGAISLMQSLPHKCTHNAGLWNRSKHLSFSQCTLQCSNALSALGSSTQCMHDKTDCKCDTDQCMHRPVKANGNLADQAQIQSPLPT